MGKVAIFVSLEIIPVCLRNEISCVGIIGAAILDDCDLFSTLSWVTAAPLAAGNTIVLLVKPSYSVIVLYFVSLLHEFGYGICS